MPSGLHRSPSQRRPGFGRFLLLLLLTSGWAAGQVALEFWTISLAPFFNAYIEETAALFEAANPGVTVRWRDFSTEAIGFELLAAVASGRAPDVVNLNVPMVLEYAERGLLLDLAGELEAGAAEAYFERLLASFSVAGEQLGLPWYLAPAVLMINAELFERAGLDPGRPPADAEELVAYARTIRDRTGSYGYMPNIISQNLLYRFLEAGLPVLSEDGFEAVFDSPAHVAFLEDQVRLFQEGYFSEDAFLRGYVGAVEAFSAGQLAMLLTGPQFLTRIRQNAPAVLERVRIAPYPLAGGGVIHAPLMGVSIPRASAHPQEALRLALFVTGAERQLAFSRETAVFPSVRAAAADPFFTELPPDPSPEDLARRVEAEQLPYAQDLTMQVPNASELFRYVQRQVEAAFFGFRTPREALEAAVRFWNARL